MKTMLMTVAAAATLGATALTITPAAAQPYGGYGGNSINQRQEQIRMRIARAERQGDLTRYEAEALRQRLWQIHRIEARYRYDGRLSRWERVDLDRRLDQLSAQVRYERHDADYRGGYRRY